jgi:hypothetical protein
MIYGAGDERFPGLASLQCQMTATAVAEAIAIQTLMIRCVICFI